MDLLCNYHANVLIHSLKVGVFWVALLTIENEKKSHLYALIWDYSFINFQQKVPPIRLFSPIFLLSFKEFSHLYFYSDPSSIRNSRVLTYILRITLNSKASMLSLPVRKPKNVSYKSCQAEKMHAICLLEWPRLWQITDLSLVVNKEDQRTMKTLQTQFL